MNPLVTSSQLYKEEEKATINEAINQFKKSKAENPTGSALLVFTITPKNYSTIIPEFIRVSAEKQCSSPQEVQCSEIRTITQAFSTIAPHKIKGNRGCVALLVTASKDGSALPCQRCLEAVSNLIHENLPFLSVNEEGSVTMKTTIDQLYFPYPKRDHYKDYYIT